MSKKPAFVSPSIEPSLTAVEPTAPPASAPVPTATSRNPRRVRYVTVRIPIIDYDGRSYVARRIDTKFSAAESIVVRELLDGIQALGQPCPGSSAAIRFLLQQVVKAKADGA